METSRLTPGRSPVFRARSCCFQNCGIPLRAGRMARQPTYRYTWIIARGHDLITRGRRRVMWWLRQCRSAVALILAITGVCRADESPPDPGATQSRDSYVALSIEPQEIVIHAASRRQQLLITARRADGKLVDVTRQAEFSLADDSIARIAGTAIVGNRDGMTALKVVAGGQSADVRVRVQGFERYPPVHFAIDVVPVLSKLGCNSGGCHGRASGQNGFKLSVFGFDPAGDYDAIAKQARGRRVFAANPARSLILAKPSGGVPHGGGVRLSKDSLDYELLAQWVDQGMPVGDEKAARLVGLRVSPRERELAAGAEQQILATAIYSDGTLRDVTSAA